MGVRKDKMKDIKIDYEEKEDGILYPKINFSKDPKYEGKPLGKYGMMAQEYLKENNKMKYNELLMSGELLPQMHEIDKRARVMLHEIMDKLLEENPVKDPNNILERTRHMNQLKAQAEEIIFHDIIYKDN